MNLVYRDVVKRYLVLDEIEFIGFTRNPVWVATLGNTVVVDLMSRFWLHSSRMAWRACPTGELDLRTEVWGAGTARYDACCAEVQGWCRGGAGGRVQGRCKGCRGAGYLHRLHLNKHNILCKEVQGCTP